ncbi:putative lipid II flippase FtsW [Patescibacteria group bacterium]|nr:putative lipid II flippase FtsW [Patescibacteria group bacterium]
MRKQNLRKQIQSLDSKLLFVTLALVVLGLIAVADASAPQALSVFNDKYYLVKQQLVWAGLGLVLMFIASKIKYTFWEKIATPLFFICILTLIAVLIPGIGARVYGARRWIPLGFFSLQPSEFVKLGLAVYLAKVASKHKNFWAFFIPLGIVAALIIAQPDLGTDLIVVFIGLAQIFSSGINLFLFAGAVAGGGILAFLVTFFSGYRRDRLMTFLAQSSDPLGKDYHVRQILLALGSGGIFGVGLGQSRQKFLFLPEASTDSIFAIIAEEVGFLGALVLIIIFAFFIYRAFRIAQHAPDKFSQILATGISAWIGGQMILNIASMVALVPLTGVPLPFFSYGGSALTMVLIGVGILLNISRYV